MIWLAEYERQFTHLRMNQTGGHRSPHKLCLLLAVLDLFERGEQRNRIHFDATLKARFTAHFNQYRGPSDRDNPHLPFFHLCSEPFWHHRVREGAEAAYDAMTTASAGQIDKTIAYAFLDKPLYELVQRKATRDRLRNVLISDLTGILGHEIEERGRAWGWFECELTVQSYLEMLRKELKGERYKKSDHRTALMEKLSEIPGSEERAGRSKGAIEFKYGNISAVMIDLGYPYIAGYKPASNYQGTLKDVVEVHLANLHGDLVEQAERSLDAQEMPQEEVDWAMVLEDAPAPAASQAPQKREFIPRKYNFPEREASNRKLGLAGEQFVLDFEKHRMRQAGRADLVSEIEWTSQERGDGAGYDIRSFRPDEDKELFIEVKTTNGGKYQPFLISQNEVAFSQERAEDYALYRVFTFRTCPRIYVLEGMLSGQVKLVPKIFSASV